MKSYFRLGLFCLLLIPGFIFLGRYVFADPDGSATSANPFKQEQKFPFLESETMRLVKSMIDKAYTGYTSALKGPVAGFPEGPKLTVDAAVQKEFSWLKKIKEKSEHKKDPVAKRLYGKPNLSEGDRLFRVAMMDKQISLKEAEEIGLANNTQVRSLLKKVETARSKVSEARRALFPTVQAEVTFNGGKAQGTSTIPGGRYYEGESQKLNITQPIFYDGELIATVKQAEASLRSSQEEFRKGKGEYLQQVRAAYYSAVKAEYNFQYQTTAYSEISELYEKSKKEHASGLISEIDTLNSESQFNNVYFQMETARNDLLSGYLILFQTIALDLDEPIQVDLRLDFVKINPDLYEVMDQVLRSNPEVSSKQANLEAAEQSIRVYHAKKLPKVELRGSYGMLGEVFKDTQSILTDNADLDTEKEWFMGVNVSMPLGPNSIDYDHVKHHYGPTVLALTGSEDWKDKITFNLFDRLADITDEKSAEGAYWQAVADLEKAKDDAIVKTKDEIYNLRKALIQIDTAIAKMRYQERQNGILKYLLSLQETQAAGYMEGLTEQAQNKFAFIQAMTDYHQAVSNLNILMGDPDHFQSRS